MEQHEQSKVRVLLVVEDDHLQRVLPGVFGSQGMRVVVASSVREVQKQLGRRDYDVVLLSAELLNSDGRSLLSLIHRAQPLTQVIVLVTDLWFPGIAPGLGLGPFDAVITQGAPGALAARTLAIYGIKRLQTEQLAAHVS